MEQHFSIEDNTLHRSISEQDWDKVDRILLAGTTTMKFEQQSVNLSSSSAIDTIMVDDLVLHHACLFDAPLQIIAKLSAKFPYGVDALDDDGRYPLHVAVASGCRPDVIQFLIRMNPASAGIQDKSGKTPVHHAGQCYAKSYIKNGLKNGLAIPDVLGNTFRVIELLLEAAPQSVNVEDEDGMNPIEYAVLNSAHIKVIKKMQRTSRDGWRKLKAEQCKSHEDMARDVQGGLSPSAEDLKEKSTYLSMKPVIFGRERHTCHHRVGASTA